MAALLAKVKLSRRKKNASSSSSFSHFKSFRLKASPPLLLRSTSRDDVIRLGCNQTNSFVPEGKEAAAVAVPYFYSHGWYLYIGLLLAGAVAGIILLAALYLFFRNCRHNSVSNNKNHLSKLTIRVDDAARYDDDPNSFNRNNAGVQEDVFAYSSDTKTLRRISPPKVYRNHGSLDNDELEETLVISNDVTPLRQGDGPGKSCLVLQKQKSYIQESSPSGNSYCNNKLQSSAGYEVAVDVHSLGGEETNSLQLSDRLRSDYSQTPDWGAGRASSTDWSTPLECGLEYWQWQHKGSNGQGTGQGNYTPTPTPKVSYNDTGSLEEVNVENVVDYLVEDDIVIDLEASRAKEKVKCFSCTELWRLRTTLEVDEGNQGVIATFASGTGRRSSHSQSSSSPSHSYISPDVHTCSSQTTSFESNTEPIIEENVGTRMPPSRVDIHSYEARKQSYRRVAASMKMHSFESADTDSTTTTDIGPNQPRAKSLEGDYNYKRQYQRQQQYRQYHQLAYQQQQHARSHLVSSRVDSGYRSFDYPKTVTYNNEMIASVEEASEGEYSVEEYNQQRREAGQQGNSASKKRRDFSRMNDKTRDYSIDEKSDALFKEYSRCTPSPSVTYKIHRDHKRHHRQQSTYQPPHQHSKLKMRSAEDAYGDDDILPYSMGFSSVPIIRVDEQQDLSY